MKTYCGDRTIDGIKVTVDGLPLAAKTELTVFSRNGFEWSYEGPEPRQLAFALLFDHLDDPTQALRLSECFMRAVVANFDNEWQMTSVEISAALAVLDPLPGDASSKSAIAASVAP
jgi:hypothetical protein